ncbi:HD domain-containing protein [Caloramator sp. E03]|uniref:HD-GYP domain-containing protein n=1 Tax=Caloramator sp. E03 TaxID=2576307 RepID=UPI001110239D|nr:HD domain-containing phosphohydrolase [Caloramator sp. E03]QCX32975.1 HD domain-containing protein [Caloramator sp. E03]
MRENIEAMLSVSSSNENNILYLIFDKLCKVNPREAKHSIRVSKLCEDIAISMNLRNRDIKITKAAALLHDIGKIKIDKDILNKPGKLNEKEWIEMKKHPEYGYDILNSYYQTKEISQYVLFHHERFDGLGYPKGLKNYEIPLISRIIAVADSYDAMISVRAYKDSMKKHVAIKELIYNKGTQFDPEIVDIFIEKVL